MGSHSVYSGDLFYAGYFRLLCWASLNKRVKGLQTVQRFATDAFFLGFSFFRLPCFEAGFTFTAVYLIGKS